MVRKQRLFFNTKTGSIVSALKHQVKRLPEDYQEIEFTKNESGTAVMRFRFNGATVDVLDNTEKALPNG